MLRGTIFRLLSGKVSAETYYLSHVGCSCSNWAMRPKSQERCVTHARRSAKARTGGAENNYFSPMQTG